MGKISGLKMFRAVNWFRSFKISDVVFGFIGAGLLISLLFGLERLPTKPSGAPVFSTLSLGGQTIYSNSVTKPTVVIFWTTWCPPCRIELARIQNLINLKQLDPTAVLAVSIGEDPTLVRSVIQDRGYTFQVVLDSSGDAARAFGVEATPTIIFRNADGSVDWMTSGLSPSLEIRVSRFLNRKPET